MTKTWFLIFSLTPLYTLSFGLGEYRVKTKNGSSIDNYMGNHKTITLQNHSKVESVMEWYFYKNHIIGRSLHNDYEKKTYKDEWFIINEITSEVEKYNLEENWVKKIKLKSLDPKLWTRWHNDEWEYHWFIIVILAFISFPFILMFWMTLNMTELFKNLKIYRLAIITTLLLSSTLYFLGKLPQSI